MDSFITIHKNYDKHSIALLRDPKCVGSFSLDTERKIHHDKQNLKYINLDLLKEKNVFMDLDKGMHNVIRKDPYLSSKEKLDILLQWILANKCKFETEESKKKGFKSLSTDFVCFRGLLTQLMCTPYERNEEWIIHAVSFRNTIYLLNINTDAKIENLGTRTEQDHRMCSWGYKFEQYMTFEDTNEAVNENEEYNCVLRSRLANNSLLYSAEVDGVDKSTYNDKDNTLRSFVELKTTKECYARKQLVSLRRYKMKKWYCQSYLAGVPRLITGYKEDQHVTRLENFQVSDFPKICKVYWDPLVMLNFLNEFLEWVKIIVIEENPRVYEFRTSLQERRVYGNSVASAQSFLPHWYTTQLFSQ